MKLKYFRWIFSPLENVADPAGAIPAGFDYPVCRYYARRWRAPRHHNGHALVYCELGPSQLAKARQDERLTVLENDELVPDHITAHHAELGVKQGMALREMLRHLAQYHCCFEPE